MAQIYSNDFYEPVKDFFHCYTDGNCADVMFPDNDAKIHGMNIIPALTLRTGVVVIAFVLMDNHVHFCLQGGEDECRRFIKAYLFSVSNYLSKRFAGEYKDVGFKWSMLPVTTKGQLMKTVAYIFRNPLMAGFDKMPSEYPWSNASDCFMDGNRLLNIHGMRKVFALECLKSIGGGGSNSGGFAASDDECAQADGSTKYKCRATEGANLAAKGFVGHRTIGSLGPTERRTLLKVRYEYPNDWVVDERGVILTSHYSEGGFIENRIFGSVRRYLYYLASKCEEEVNDAIFRNQGKFLSDADVRSLAKSLSWEAFGRRDIRRLPLDQKVRLVRAVRKKVGCSNTQLARVLGTPVKDWIGFV